MDILRSGEVLRWVPVGVARAMLRVSRQRVYQLLDSGALQGQQIGGHWLVSTRSIESRIALLEQEARRADGRR